ATQIANVISGLALVTSAAALVITHNFNRRQKSLLESQEKLNNILLSKELQSTENDKKAELGATFIRAGSRGSYRLKVWNKGKCAARNIVVTFPEGNNIIPHSELKSKTPIISLEPQTGVEFLAAIHMGTEPKQLIGLAWDDDMTKGNSKVIPLIIS
ncbi:MAG: hypothetical protein ACK5V3_17780, partial [Bdellovibrionales bacterium]